MCDDRKVNYIPESEVDESDVRLPEPTGTRNSLTVEDEFVNFVGSKRWKIISETLDKYLKEITTLNEFMDMNKYKRDHIIELLKVTKHNESITDFDILIGGWFDDHMEFNIADLLRHHEEIDYYISGKPAEDNRWIYEYVDWLIGSDNIGKLSNSYIDVNCNQYRGSNNIWYICYGIIWRSSDRDWSTERYAGKL